MLVGGTIGLTAWASIWNFQYNMRRDHQTKGYQECMSKVAANHASTTRDYNVFDMRLADAKGACREAYPKARKY